MTTSHQRAAGQDSRRTLQIAYRPVASLIPNSRNARRHSPKQVRQIAASIEAFGFTNPILIDAEGQVLAGHGRLAAARQLGLDTVPTISIEHLSEAEARAYLLADNRLAENASWDERQLARELELLLGTDLDVTLTGFELPDADLIIQSAHPATEPECFEEPAVPVVSVPGDRWLLEEHAVFCGDARDASAFSALMAGEQADLVFTDPPYNVPVNGHVRGRSRVQHPEFAVASGELTTEEFQALLASVFEALVQHSKDGSLHYVFMDWRHMGECLGAGLGVYDALMNMCVWDKGRGGMGSLYRSQHELVLVFKQGKASHVNNVSLGRHGRNRSNVWRYPALSVLTAAGRETHAMHPTVKPVSLVSDALLDASHRGDIVLDPFGGSGTTLLAAERTGRRARVMEIEPRYVDLTVRRWEAESGLSAVHAATGLGFDALADVRQEGGSHGG